MEYLQDHDERLQITRDFAQWQLGDPTWADELIFCYCNHRIAKETLEVEGFYDEDE